MKKKSIISLILETFRKRKQEMSEDVAFFRGVYLPTQRSNESLSDNQAYVDSALELVESLEGFVTLDEPKVLLDFGCGQGRLANGFRLSNRKLEKYIGIDTNETSINWCSKWLASGQEKFNFIHLNAHNARYNPEAKSRRRLPIDDSAVDIVFMNSVFSHMLAEDVLFYSKEFRRVLRAGGIIYLTAFVEDGVADVTENPEGYLGRDSSGPLHRVRYERGYFTELLGAAGFDDVEYSGCIERTGQSVVVARCQSY